MPRRKPERRRCERPPIDYGERVVDAVVGDAPAPVTRRAWQRMPSIDDVLRASLRRWKLAASVAVAITLLVWIIAAMQPKRYRAVATAAVTPRAQEMKPSELLRGVDVLSEPVILNTIAALASTPQTIAASQASPDDRVESDAVVTTNLFTVTVEARDAVRAAAVANAIPPAVASQAKSLFPMYAIHVVSAASAPSRPVLPRMPRALATGIALGIALGAAAAYVLERRAA